jgi:DNA-binding NarL/FixJ family response regulator
MDVNPLRVYLVEDSLIIFGLLRDLVEGTGASVVGHSVGAYEAIEEIGKTAPDVVVIDIALTDGSGFEVLKTLADQDSRPVVYILSNHAASPFRERAALLGADRFFSKDQEMTALVGAVADMVKARRANGERNRMVEGPPLLVGQRRG